jgi:hypothetical protein
MSVLFSRNVPLFMTRNRNGLCILSMMFTLFLFQSIQHQSHDGLAIIVPGGGLQANGTLPLHTKARLDKAIQLFMKHKARSPVVVTLSAGTTHKPNPIDDDNFPIYESSAAIKYLLSYGISPNLLLEEKLSLDTIGNVGVNLSLNEHSCLLTRN